MDVTLVGADFEENLGVGMIAAAAAGAGHAVTVRPFNLPSQAAALAREIAAAAPAVVGLSIQFQHRAHEFLALAEALRAAGYRGHVTCGGQFPTLTWADLLARRRAVDSVVLHEGEETFVALLAALAAGTPLGDVHGLALRGDDGAARRTPGRRLPDDLDALPFPARYRPHTKHLGVPFVPIMGARGCWGACVFCSITTFYRDAREHGGGRTLRHRTPANVAAEMALLAHAAGGDAIFCFHDDNFLLPRPEASLARVRAIRAALDAYGLGRIGIIGKCRPDSLTPDLARELRALGVLRLYVGVENASQRGADHLGRRTQMPAVRAALAACREAGIFVCYNLLLFEPDATLDDVRENVRFMREHAHHPVNFCRAEPYAATPLERDLGARQALGGSWLGYNYRIEDDRAELLFRVCAAAFRQRNFDPDGVANRSMGIGYSLKILEHFHGEKAGRLGELARRGAALGRAIVEDTADHLEAAVRLAETLDPRDHDRVAREAALLGLRVAATDRLWHAGLDALYAAMDACARDHARPPPRPASPRLHAARRLAIGASLAAWAAGCNGGCRSSAPIAPDPLPPPTRDAGQTVTAPDPPPPPLVDPAPPPVDPPPPDMGRVDAGPVPMVVDPPPRPIAPDPLPRPRVDAGRPPRRPTRPTVLPMDPPPPRLPPHVVDPPPPTFRPPVTDPLPSPRKADARLPLVDQWRDAAADGVRSRDLPLDAPPDVTLRATRDGATITVRVEGGPDAVSTRWEADGEVTGSGRAVTWTPTSPTDQVRVAVRAAGGVAVAALRALDVA